MSDYAALPLTNIKVVRDGAVLNMTFNRPDILNPLDTATLREFDAILTTVEADPQIEIVMIRGEGRAFSAGGDLKRHLQIHRDVPQMSAMGRLARSVMERIDRSERLFIAVIDGLAVAGGVELMLHCDVVVASEESAFSNGHLNISLLPGGGGSQLLPRMINPLRAKLFMLTAGFISGREAVEIGLISAAYPRAQLADGVSALLENLLAKSFSSRAAIKHLVNQSMRIPLEAGFTLEGTFCEHYETTHPDAHEGLVAFAEKRKPVFARPA